MRPSSIRSFVVSAVLACLTVMSTVSAEEVVEFTDGRTLSVRGHHAVDGAIVLDLGPRASIAFPATHVARIERAGVSGHVRARSEPRRGAENPGRIARRGVRSLRPASDAAGAPRSP